MPAIIVTEPGVSLPGFTAAAASAAQVFTLQERTVALVGLIADEPWAWSSDDVNFVNVAADTAWILPILYGENKSITYYFKRTGGTDATMQVWVAG